MTFPEPAFLQCSPPQGWAISPFRRFKSWGMALTSTPLVQNHSPCSECPVHVCTPLPQTLPPSVWRPHTSASFMAPTVPPVLEFMDTRLTTATLTTRAQPLFPSLENDCCVRVPRPLPYSRVKRKALPKDRALPLSPLAWDYAPLTSKSISGYFRPLLFPRHLVFPPSSSWHQNPFFGSNLKRLEACE